jgi:phosphatidylglycerol:prolipoprotein diacylglycerol transferase
VYPDIVHLGPFTVTSYGLALTLSFFLGLLLALRRAPARGIKTVDVMDLFQVIVISSVLGARFFFVIFHLDFYRGRWWRMAALWEGGLTLYGGLLLAFLASWLFLRARKIPFLRVADVFAPSLGLGIMVTRLGCFLRGCCFGLPTQSSVGVHFPAGSEASRTAYEYLLEHAHGGGVVDLPLSPAVYPAQLFASLAGLLILVILLLLDRKRRPEGMIFAAFLALYGIKRFTVDFFRYYEDAMRVLGLSVNQWLSIGMLAAGLYLMLRLRRRAV